VNSSPQINMMQKPGSISSPISYSLEHQAFRQPLPEHLQRRREEVKEFITRKPLGAKQEWNADTHTGESVYVRFPVRELSRYQPLEKSLKYDFHSPKQPKKSPLVCIPKTNKFTIDPMINFGLQYQPGVDPSPQATRGVPRARSVSPKVTRETDPDVAGPMWNASTILHKKEVETGLQTLREKSLLRSRQRTVERPTLVERESHFLETLRTTQHVSNAPTSPQSRDPADMDMEEIRKRVWRDMQATRGPPNIVVRRRHPGSYAHSALENREVWSCCMAFNKDSPGCEVIKINRDRWQLGGFC